MRSLKREVPMPVTVNDCLLLSQMGYDVNVNDGQVSKVVKKKKHSKRALK